MRRERARVVLWVVSAIIGVLLAGGYVLSVAKVSSNRAGNSGALIAAGENDDAESWRSTSFAQFKSTILLGDDGMERAKKFVRDNPGALETLAKRGEVSEAKFWSGLIAMSDDPMLSDLSWIESTRALANEEKRKDVEFFCVFLELGAQRVMSRAKLGGGEAKRPPTARLAEILDSKELDAVTASRLLNAASYADQDFARRAVTASPQGTAHEAAARLNLANLSISAAISYHGRGLDPRAELERAAASLDGALKILPALPRVSRERLEALAAKAWVMDAMLDASGRATLLEDAKRCIDELESSELGGIALGQYSRVVASPANGPQAPALIRVDSSAFLGREKGSGGPMSGLTAIFGMFGGTNDILRAYIEPAWKAYAITSGWQGKIESEEDKALAAMEKMAARMPPEQAAAFKSSVEQARRRQIRMRDEFESRLGAQGGARGQSKRKELLQWFRFQPTRVEGNGVGLGILSPETLARIPLSERAQVEATIKQGFASLPQRPTEGRAMDSTVGVDWIFKNFGDVDGVPDLVIPRSGDPKMMFLQRENAGAAQWERVTRLRTASQRKDSAQAFADYCAARAAVVGNLTRFIEAWSEKSGQGKSGASQAEKDMAASMTKMAEIRRRLMDGPPRSSEELTFTDLASVLPRGTLYVAIQTSRKGDGYNSERMRLCYWLNDGSDPGATFAAFDAPLNPLVVEGMIRAFNEEQDHEASANFLAASAAVAERLFPPEIRPWLQRADRVVISPSGPFWALPYEALVLNNDGAPEFLGLLKPISLVPSIASLAPAPSGVGSETGRAVFLGEDTFDWMAQRKSALRWQPSKLNALTHTRREVTSCASLHKTAPLSAGAVFSPDDARGARILHFASHGFAGWKNQEIELSMEDNLKAGPVLLLKQTSDGTQGIWLPTLQTPLTGAFAEDGLLQAWEVETLAPLKADVVFLAACNSGKTSRYAPELPRAFLRAGARSVVATRNMIGDDLAALAAAAFHRDYASGGDKDRALLAARKAVFEKNPAPSAWGTYYLLGVPQRSATTR